MAEATKSPVKTGETSTAASFWRPMENLRREIDRVFEDFGAGDLWRRQRNLFAGPFFQGATTAGLTPAVDIVEKDKAFEITADVPGFDEKNIEVKVVNGSLSIKGERKSEKEEKKEGYHLSEREFGSFERSFPMPEGVDASKIAASVKKGVLTISLPKTEEACKPARKIEVKPGA